MKHEKTSSSIKDLFINGFGLVPEEMEIGKDYTVEESGIEIQTLGKNGKKKFSKVLKAIRKPKTEMYVLFLISGETLRAAGNHKIAILKEGNIEWLSLEEIYKIRDSFNLPIRTVKGESELSSIEPDGEDCPLDIEVEGEHSYFSNNILSHNTLYGPDFTVASGGKAPLYYSSWNARITKTEEITGPNKELEGLCLRIRNTKNKLGIPKRDANVKLYFKNGINSEEEYIDYLKVLGLVEQKGAYYSNPEWVADDGTVGMKVCGIEKVKEYFRDNPKLYEKIKAQVNELIAGHSVLDENTAEAADDKEAALWAQLGE